jgi:hypothetical protein
VRYSKDRKRKASKLLGLNPNKKYSTIPKIKVSICSVARQLEIKKHDAIKKWIFSEQLNTLKVKTKKLEEERTSSQKSSVN